MRTEAGKSNQETGGKNKLFLWMMVGMSVGLALGTAFGVTTDNRDMTSVLPADAALDSESERIVEQLTLRETVARWGPVEIGLSLTQLSDALGEPIAVQQRGNLGTCDHVATVELGGRAVSIAFSGSEPAATVQGIFIPLLSSSKPEVVSALKHKFPGLVYRPSRHDPELPEQDNDIPFYEFPENPEIGILVRPVGGAPPAGLNVSVRDCFE